jgi:tetratricopeptide (TPR) repeat protein
MKKLEEILQLHDKHSETHALKALILNQTGKKEEAKALIMTALMFNLKSPTSWYINGSINRSTKNFEQAKQCYVKSVEFEEKNANVYKRFACTVGSYVGLPWSTWDRQ